MKVEQACNGLQLATAAADDDDDKFKFNRTFLPIKTNQKNNCLLHSVENVTLTGRIHLLKYASFRTREWNKMTHK
jgi:hypothetical protein